MMPTAFITVTKMKNFRYVLNQRLKRIHRLGFGLGGAGFFATVVLRAAASVAPRQPVGHDSDSSGTLENGVVPSWTGEPGNRWVSMCISGFLGPEEENGGGPLTSTMLGDELRSCAVLGGDLNSTVLGTEANSTVLSHMPFSASSSESWLRLPAMRSCCCCEPTMVMKRMCLSRRLRGFEIQLLRNDGTGRGDLECC